jgi:hypothetical protein
MRAHEFLNEDSFGTNPKRKMREGSRPARGHAAQPTYKEQVQSEDFDLDEAGKAPKKLCLSKKTDKELGASQLSSCKAQGLRKRDTKRKFNIGNKVKKIKGKMVKSSDYGGPLPKWKGNE